VLFAFASRIPHRPTQIALRTIAVVAGPLFFLVSARSPHGEEVSKEYMDKVLRNDIQHMGINDYEDFVVIKQGASAGRGRFESLDSKELVHTWKS
jgi:hypothetical protein